LPASRARLNAKSYVSASGEQQRSPTGGTAAGLQPQSRALLSASMRKGLGYRLQRKRGHYEHFLRSEEGCSLARYVLNHQKTL
jgi:hypothetical protein